MPRKSYFELSDYEKSTALKILSSKTGRFPFLLEKDIWIVWTLDQLFNSPFGGDLVFKGGTSLSKAYNIIDRFSEDIDITYDIRAIASDLTSENGVIPPTNSQAKRWTKEIRKRLTAWVVNDVQPILVQALNKNQIKADILVDGDVLRLIYSPLTKKDSGYVKSEVLLEFGARSTGEPTNDVTINCDAAVPTPDILFPTAKVRAMKAERTFWEKSTAVHIVSVGARIRGKGNIARHWYDLMRLDKAGIADKAILDRELAHSVAEHQSAFFREKDGEGNWIDFYQALGGSLRLVPTGQRRNEIEEDYNSMVESGMVYSDIPSFDNLMNRLSDIERRTNAV